MKTTISKALMAATFFAGALVPMTAIADDAKEVIDHSTSTLQTFVSDPNVASLLKKAKGVVIIPKFVKAGFIVGGASGDGVLVAKTAKGWSQPAFFEMGQGSIGFQVGAESQQILIVIMTDHGLNELADGKLSVGGDASATAWDSNKGVNEQTATSDMITFVRSKGGYAGVSVSGGDLDDDEDKNEDFYGKNVDTKAIIAGTVTANPGSAQLLNVLKAY